MRIEKVETNYGFQEIDSSPVILNSDKTKRGGTMSIEHKHILINAKINDPLETFDDAINFLEDLVDRVGMKILMGPHATYVDTPGNKGVTAIVGIETSHIAFHIWDEEMPARLQFDLYTCGSLDKDIVIEAVKERFQVVSADYRIYDREHGFVLLEEGTI
jgi:S-adenosylmethionine/arginine decarboxylase-like enzyme